MLKKNLFIFTVICRFGMDQVHACGLTSGMPVNHFDGVNEQGYVSYWQEIGEIVFSGNVKFPVAVNFNSKRGANSPYLGFGWLLPLLESSIVQVNETQFIMTEPDGHTRYFGRKNGADTVLRGQGDWTAEIQEGKITAWAACGWKLTFLKGHLSTMVGPDGVAIELVTENGRVVSVKQGGAVKLSVEYEQADGPAKALVLAGKRIELALGQRPEVQVIAGQNLVAAMRPSLSSLEGSGTKTNFEYAVDATRRPTLTIRNGDEKGRAITWDPHTKKISKDGAWTYTVLGGENSFVNANISRVNKQNQQESWFYDIVKGRETLRSMDGVTKVSEYTLSGILAGQLRKESKQKDGQETETTKYRYDERGNLIGILKNSKETGTLEYDYTAPESVAIVENGVKKVFSLQDLLGRQK